MNGIPKNELGKDRSSQSLYAAQATEDFKGKIKDIDVSFEFFPAENG